MTRHSPLVLCYHAVSERWPSELAVRPARLEQQLRALLARGYRAVTFSTAAAASPGARLLAVTFDDGFDSIVAAGLPVLERLGIPATAFVPSAFVGRSSMSWPGIDHWLDGPFAGELKPVSWDSLSTLADAGWEIGSHSCWHPRLTELGDAELDRELRQSRAMLEAHLGRSCSSIAYPFGAVDERVIAAARVAGYRSGAALPIRLTEGDILACPRVGIYRNDGPWRFGVKTSPTGRAMRSTPAAAPMVVAQRLSLAISGATRPTRARARTAIPAIPGVLVTDAGERSMLAVARALGGCGYRVGAIAAERPAAVHWSRFCDQRFVLPDPLLDEDRYVAGLANIVSSGRYSVLIPGSDAALLIASRHRRLLEPHVRIGLPSHETVLRSTDKTKLAELAAGTGLVVPDTLVCAGVEDALRAARRFGYPVALKPLSSVFEFGGGLRHLPARLVHDEAELLHAAPAYGERCLIQRQERGTLLAYGGVFAGGRLLASAAARAWRTHRPDSGSLAFCEAIAVDPALRGSVAELMGRIGHTGIFELDLVARTDGTVALLDLNPRPYGALALALRGGANLPRIWCEWLLGDGREAPVPAQVEAAAGALYRWEDADLFHLLRSLHERRLRSAAAVLRPHRHVVHAFFSATDPGPFAAHMLCLIADLARDGLIDRRELGLHPSPESTGPV